jgi:hypothetical protein
MLDNGNIDTRCIACSDYISISREAFPAKERKKRKKTKNA